ncbi:MAG: macro domain-containing protein [Armatimonadota bacterium]
MLHYSDTTVFNVNAQVIVNTVNCVGVMGNGLALECRLRYPEMFTDYVVRCRRGEVQIGKPYLYWYAETFGILNFPCKDHWKFPSRVEWIRRGLSGFLDLLPQYPITSIAFPPLGCDLGRLRWRDVQPVMEHALGGLPYDVHICLDREECATGIEGAMVGKLNDVENPFWLSALDLPSRTQNALRAVLPVKRIRDLRQADGVGKTTYERVHRYLYGCTCS